MERTAIIENDTVVNVVKAPADWTDPNGRETVSAPRGSGVEIGAERQEDGSWKVPEPPIEELRARATLPKDDFILSALDAKVLSEADAEEATNGWPTGWDDFFTGQPARERIEAKARWASAATIKRDAPLIEALAAFKGLTPEQVDALFGINV